MAKANSVVLVGTYRSANEEWIKSRKLYNLPLPKCGKVAFHDRISRIVLIAEGCQTVAYAAKLKDVVDRDWLKTEGYKVAPKDAAHGEKYALYELGEKLSAPKVLSDASADVFVSSSRCPNVRIDAAFYSKPYPRTGGKSMPYIFDKLKPYFKKWHSATTFSPVQLDFFSELNNESIGLVGNASDDVDRGLACLDFFAGSGLVSVALSGFFKTVWANDISEKKARVFNANNKGGILKIDSIENVRGVNLPSAALSWGSFPCQDLSLAGDMNGLYASRSGLFWQWLRVMDEMTARPPVVVAENVLGLVSAEGGAYYKIVHRELVKRGYKVGAVMLDAVHWVPQSRKRIFVVAVRSDIETMGFMADGPTWCHPAPVRNVARQVKKWVWWSLPRPPKMAMSLEDIIEFDAPCDSIDEVNAKLSLISDKKIEMVKLATRNQRRVFTGYRRTRNHKQVLEVRMDGIAGCLRTPCGGSSRQIVVIGKNGKVKTRLLTVRETARLMGAPDDFKIPGSYNDGYMAMGDGVAVPVARYLAEHLLAPLASKVAK